MKAKELLTALPVLMKHNIVPFIWGSQGIGKTSIVKQVVKTKGPNFGFVHLHLATQEVGDLIGLLTHNKDKSAVYHSRPSWFPTEGEGIIFLDELNRAHPDVISAIFSLILEKKIHEHVLPSGWKLVAAGNYQSDKFTVTDTSDSAWMSRFCHIDFKPSVEEFIIYAEENKAYTVANFIRAHPEMLEKNDKDSKLDTSMITPDRRAMLDLVGALETEDSIDEIRYDLYAGIIGTAAAAAFLTFKTKAYSRLSGMDILNSGSSAKVKKQVKEALADKDTVRLDLLNSAVEEILVYLDSEKTELKAAQIKNFQDFLTLAPLELCLKVCKRLEKSKWQQKRVILMNKEFLETLKQHKVVAG